MFAAKFRQLDPVLLITGLLILIFGLVMIYSTTINAVSVAEGLGAFRQQILYSLLALFMAGWLMFQDYHHWRMFQWPVYGLMLLGLIAVLFLAGDNEATRRWIDLGPARFQPSEFAKLAMAMVTASVLANRSRFAGSLHFMLVGAMVLVPPALLVMIQPDLGTAIMFFALWFGMMVGVGVRWRYLGGVALSIAAMMPVLWGFLKEYQKNRIYIFLDPMRDPDGAGYNVLQAMIAHGAGGVLGVGLGQGTQTQYKFLPVRHTDFIFSVISEELGLIGALVLIGLFGVLLWRVLEAVNQAEDNFGRYLCLAVFILLFGQLVINIGMNIGLLPVTGIPLPLVSYGGSSLIVTWLMIAMVQSVIIHSRKKQAYSGHLVERVPLIR